jgi:hypothetical protein
VVRSVGHRENGKNLELIIAAEVPLTSRPALTSENKISLPEMQVKIAQEALEIAINVLSISTGSRRHISSLSPYLAIKPGDEEDRKWLDSTDGVDIWTQTLPTCNVELDITDGNLAKGLSDRMDGVALLSEALSQSNATAMFHEFMRLFERAFRLNRNSLIRPLSKFLDKSYYTEDIIRRWVVELRNPATHAYKNYEFLLEADIRPDIHMIEQVAFDVLLNKLKWYDPSPTRRSFHQFKTRVTPGSSSLYIKKGYTGTIDFQILDGMLAYPVNLGVVADPSIFGYWSKNYDNIKSKQYIFSVVEEP